jgi:DNA-directed RNA polymerase subunit RPC12/RpoP
LEVQKAEEKNSVPEIKVESCPMNQCPRCGSEMEEVNLDLRADPVLECWECGHHEPLGTTVTAMPRNWITMEEWGQEPEPKPKRTVRYIHWDKDPEK